MELNLGAMLNSSKITNLHYYEQLDILRFNYNSWENYAGKYFKIEETVYIRDTKKLYPRLSFGRDFDPEYTHFIHHYFYYPFNNVEHISRTYLCVGAYTMVSIFQIKNNYSIEKWFEVYGLPNICNYYYWESYKIFPHGELAHGEKGNLDDVIEKFGITINNVISVINDLKSDKKFTGILSDLNFLNMYERKKLAYQLGNRYGK